MSYIDCFKHEVVGDVIGLPLYKANEDIDGGEFTCKKDQLILGGGGGEHPGVVLKNINTAVKYYLYFKKNVDEFDYVSEEGEQLDFVDWSIRTNYEFYKRARKNGYSKKKGYLEYWIIIKIAKFVIEKQPNLIDKDLLKHLS